MTHRQRIAGDMSVTDIAQDQQAHGMTMIKIDLDLYTKLLTMIHLLH